MQIFDNAVEELGEDAKLPAVENMRRFFLKGIGIHHGGLIPLVKELVEILFQVGWLVTHGLWAVGICSGVAARVHAKGSCVLVQAAGHFSLLALASIRPRVCVRMYVGIQTSCTLTRRCARRRA